MSLMTVSSYRFPLLLSLSLPLLLQGIHHWVHDLAYQRHIILAGEWWRLLTGGWVHSNHIHLVMNLLALALLWLLFVPARHPWRRLGELALLVVWVDVSILLFDPDTRRYVGLSGALHGLFVWGCLRELAAGRRSRWFWLLGLGLKLVWDLSHPDGVTAALIETRVHAGSHLYGSLGGLLLGLAELWLQKRRAVGTPR